MSELEGHAKPPTMRSKKPIAKQAYAIADALASGNWKADFRQDPILWLFAASRRHKQSQSAASSDGATVDASNGR